MGGANDPELSAKLRNKIDCTIYYCAEATRIVGILLQPYMPAKASQLLDMLGVEESKRTFDNARIGTDYDYGVPKIPVGREAWDALFPPLPVDT
jgi:methionyl-tRNA synthetase